MKCLFLGGSVFEDNIKTRIYDLMIQLIKEREKIEFWFYTGEYAFRSFDSICLYTALLLKSKFPEKDIKIVYVSNYIEAIPYLKNNFPIWLCDKIYSPEFDTNFKYKNKYIQHKFQWILSKMDYVYYYLEPYSYTQELNAIQLAIRKKPELEAVSLISQDTENYVENFLKQFYPERKHILSLLFEGKSTSDVSKKYNISRQAVYQIRHSTTQKIRAALISKRKSVLYTSCYITNLTHYTKTKAAKLSQTLTFITEQYQTNELWIDWEHCHLSYIQLIFKIFSSIKNISINVLVNSTSKKLHALNFITSKFPNIEFKIIQVNCKQVPTPVYYLEHGTVAPCFIVTAFSEGMKNYITENRSVCLINISSMSPSTH